VQIQLTTGDDVLRATLIDNAASRDFAALLPLTLTLTDFNRTEKIADLPARLSTEGCPPGVTPEIGDIAYYAPWGNLAIFYRDFGYSNGLVKLGHLEQGTELLRAVASGAAVRIELVHMTA
jgi:hypothetical protein